MPLPAADLYICTGDMLPDMATYDELCSEKGSARLRSRWLQAKFLANKHSYRKLFARIEAPVVVVRGNHDWVWLSKVFGGEVYEMGIEPTVFEFGGLRVGGMRGIKHIIGAWSDEIDDATALERVQKMPKDIDILVTHSPAEGYLDLPQGHFKGVGLQAFSSYIRDCFFQEDCRLSLHLFGHVHNQFGVKREGDYGFQDILFSNAATGYIVLEDVINNDGSRSWNTVSVKRLPKP